MALGGGRFRLNHGGVGDVLKSGEVRDYLTEKAEAVLDAATGSAPVESGDYAASIHIEQETTDRVAVRVVADVPYAMVVEAATGNMARALDAAG